VAHRIEELIGLLAVVAVLAYLARAAGLPYPVVLVVGGLALGYVPGLPDITIDPDVVFLVFVPPLVHAAGYTSSPRRLRENAPLLTALAVGLVAVTIAAVAVVAHAMVPELTWAAAVALGAIVAPTDPVAATSAFRRAGVPERIVSIVEGESLLNDGSGLVAYRLAVAAVVSGSFSVLHGAGDLVSVSAGGVGIGFAVAWLSTQLRRRLDDPLIEITVTLLTPYLAYIAAE
jgi:CPA1 family monovalent cation:H+ antiporter